MASVFPLQTTLPAGFYLRIPVLDRKTKVGWSPGVTYTTVEETARAFAGFMAVVYARELKRAIDNQRFKAHWEPLTPLYLQYKQRLGMEEGIWEATLLLHDNIIAWQDGPGGQFVVGPDPRVRYKRRPGSKSRKKLPSILQVAKWMEFGTRRMPARPLFRPLQVYLSKHIERYWREFLQQKTAGVKAAKLKVIRAVPV